MDRRARRGLPALALLVVLSLVAAACGDDDDGGGESTATTGAPPETTGPGETTATTGTDTTEPGSASGATIGDDGRLVPGECAEGELTDSDPEHGVTADTINFALVGIDYTTLVQLGFAASATDIRTFMQPFVDDINANGGVCGRQLDFQGVLYDIIAQQGPQACVQVTEDRANLVVLGQGGFNEAPCIADAGTVVYTQQDFPQVVLDAGGDLMFSRPPAVDDQYEATVRKFHAEGALDGTVGVWYGAVFLEHGDAVEERILPLLDELGVDYVASRTNEIGPSAAEGQAIIRTTAAQFRDAGVDTVLNFTQTTNHVGLQLELDTLGVQPVWLSAPIGANSANDIFAETFGTQQIADGERIVTTWAPISGFTTPAVESCAEQFVALGGEEYPPDSFDYRGLANICHQLDMLVAAFTAASPDITQESFIAALESLPPHPMGVQLSPQRFGPGDHIGADTYDVLLYDGSTNSYSLEGDTFTLEELR
jgi:hypothetical protein